MVLPEAMAAGLPVVASDRAMSAHELLVDGHNGLMFPAGDIGALANHMAFAIQNREWLVRLLKMPGISSSIPTCTQCNHCARFFATRLSKIKKLIG